MRTRRLSFGAALLVSGVSATLQAQAPVPIPIRDNSFLIEEAYNQEWGVVQHVGTYQRVRGVGGWGATFTQEWPVPSERHQLSYTIPLSRSAGGRVVIGWVALNYRYQVSMQDGSPFALAPRFSLLRQVEGAASIASSRYGTEVNVPVSIALSRSLVTHFNVGANWVGDGSTLTSPSESFLGASVIFLAHPKFNVMVEALASEEGGVEADGGFGGGAFHISPGFRGAIDFPSGLQIVPGIAFPIGVGRSEGEGGIYLYLSFEHPFRRR